MKNNNFVGNLKKYMKIKIKYKGIEFELCILFYSRWGSGNFGKGALFMRWGGESGNFENSAGPLQIAPRTAVAERACKTVAFELARRPGRGSRFYVPWVGVRAL